MPPRAHRLLDQLDADQRATSHRPCDRRLDAHTRRNAHHVDDPGSVVAGTLHDNPAANTLVQRLPMTLTFDDFGAVEKIAPLVSPLPMSGMPAGADPEIGDIGFWAPGGDLVLYYGEVGYWNGIARLGTFDDVGAIEGQPGPFTITIAFA